MQAEEFIFKFILHSLDLVLVVWILYLFLRQIESKKALATLLGFSLIFLLNLLSKFLGLATMAWILDGIVTYFGLVLLIIFRDETRRALGLLGGFIVNLRSSFSPNKIDLKLKEALKNLSNKRIESFIILERSDRFLEHLKNGFTVNAILSPETLEFFATNLKGGILISENCIKKVGFLVLGLDTESGDPVSIKKSAAIWLTKRFDCVVFTVSSEDGQVEIIQDGKVSTFSENLIK